MARTPKSVRYEQNCPISFSLPAQQNIERSSCDARSVTDVSSRPNGAASSLCFNYDIVCTGIIRQFSLIYTQKQYPITLSYEITTGAYKYEVVVVVANHCDQCPCSFVTHELFVVGDRGDAGWRRESALAQ